MSDLDLSIETRALKSVLARAAGAAATRSTIPILSCCMLDAADGRLTITSSDAFVTERSSAEATVKSPGSLCVDARTFGDMVKNLPTGEVKLKQTGHSLEIKCGKVRYKLPSMPSDDFPPVHAGDKAVPVVSLASDVMLRLIAQGAYAMSTDDTRPHLCGMLLECVNDVVSVVSTDGHRLALANIQAPHATTAKILLPGKGVAELKKLCGSAEQVEIRRDGKILLLITADTTVTVVGNDETFPPYAKVVPSSHKHRVLLSRDLLADAVKRVSLIAGKAVGGGLRLQFSEGELSIYGQCVDAGEAQESIDCDADFELKLGVAGAYLAQALAALTSDDVALELLGELDPIVVKGVGEDSASGVVMPQRI